jgi:hypothetical protein
VLVSIHDLDGDEAVGRIDKQPGTVNPVNFPVCSFLFERGQSPSSDKPVPDALIHSLSRHRPRELNFNSFAFLRAHEPYVNGTPI